MDASALPLRRPPPVRLRRDVSRYDGLYGLSLLLLICGVTTNGLSFSLGGLTLSLERAVGLSFVPVLASVLLVRAVGSRARVLVWIWFAWWLVLFVSAIYTGQFVAHGVALLNAILPIAVLAFFVVRPLDTARFAKITYVTLWILGLVGTVQTLLKLATGIVILPDLTWPQGGRSRLLFFEPNILASTIVVLILINLPRSRLNWMNIILYVSALVSLGSGGSKMPMVAFVAGLAIYGFLRSVALGKSVSSAIIIPIWIVGALFLSLIPALPAIEKFYDSSLARPDAIAGRVYVNSVAIRRFQQSPLIGRGPGDFSLSDRSTLTQVGSTNAKDLWIGQMIINILHDSGIIGLGVYMTFIIALLNRGFAFIRAGSMEHCGYFAAFVSLVISCQATTVHLNSIFGLAAGLLGATPVAIWRGYRRRRSAPPQLSYRPAVRLARS